MMHSYYIQVRNDITGTYTASSKFSHVLLRKPRNVNGKLTFCSRSCCAVFYKTNERITQR